MIAEKLDSAASNKRMAKWLENMGFDAEYDDDRLCVTHCKYVNPADTRRELAKLLWGKGYRYYRLKEVYLYELAKKPHRTDDNGYVELEPTLDFTWVDPVQPPKDSPRRKLTLSV